MERKNFLGKLGKFVLVTAVFTTAFLFSIIYTAPSSLNAHAETLDDFDGNSLIAAWWTNDPSAPYVYTLDFANAEHVHSGVKALKVSYDKRNDTNTYSWLAAKGGYNLKNFDYLSFWVYNDGSPLKLRIRLEDTGTGVWESNWANIEPQMETATADWENLVVDLTRTFPAAIDMTSIDQIIFMVQPGDGTSFGTFWIDDTQVSRGPNTAPLDVFESDFYGWATGAPFSLSLSSAEFHNAGGSSDLGNHSLKVTWTTKGTDYSNFTYDPKHDSANAPLNRIGNYPNFKFNNNTNLELWVKSTTDNNIPILLKFDNTNVSTQTYTGAGAWQKLTWDYSAIAGATNVTTAYFFPYPGQSDNGGTLYVDDLNLVGGNAVVLPLAPSGFSTTAATPDGDGRYTISWSVVSSANNYQVQEATNDDFTNAVNYYPTGIYLNFTKNPQTEAGTYYYRVRSNVKDGALDNYGSYRKPISVEVTSKPSGAKNNSVSTLCAEEDNINIPIYRKNIAAYRIIATHPKYYPTSIDERGADWTDCTMTQQEIWVVGTDDGTANEFKQTGFGNNDEYYPQDSPPAGIDEPVSECPKEINNDWLNDQWIKFTTEIGIEADLGANFTIDFTGVSGTLEIKAWTWNGASWTNQGNKIFNPTTKTQTWNFPDGTWVTGTDGNNIHLDVVTAAEGGQSTAGAWGQYDYMKLVRRNLNPDVVTKLFDNGNVVVEAIKVDYWWRQPEVMAVNVTGGGSKPDTHYLRIRKKIQNEASWPESFVLYEDGNARIIPQPPSGLSWVPYGSSVIIGPAAEAERPFVDIDQVDINPLDLSMDITYGDGKVAHVELRTDRTQTIVDVDGITYNTVDYPFSTLRSMWVIDGKADVDSVQTQDGRFPILGSWATLEGNWWFFNRQVPSYHNTYSPDIKVEVINSTLAYLIREAESLNSGTGYQINWRSGASGDQVISMSVNGGEAIYNINLQENRPNSFVLIRYSDDDGGNNGDILGNTIDVYVDGVLKGSTTSVTTGAWTSFEFTPAISLGNLVVGSHQIKLVTGTGTFGIDLDKFELVSTLLPRSVSNSILTRQAESLDSGSGYQISQRSNAVGGQTITMSANGGEAIYNINLAADYKNSYIKVRYSDDVAPNSVEVFVDGVRKGKFPSEYTGGWNSFKVSPEVYFGTLTAGNHQIKLVTGAGTYGIDLDQFELLNYAPLRAVVKYINPHHYDANGIPIWLIGTTMNYELHIKNVDTQDMSNLNVQAIQEYYESGTGYTKGQALPGAPSQSWSSQSILYGTALVLPDDYFIPTETYPAYDQTHLIVSEGTLQIYNDPEAGIWCPPASWEGKSITVDVKIEPKVINLRTRNGVFTATVTLPEGYLAKNVNKNSIVCGSARAYYFKVLDVGKFIAKFRVSDLRGVRKGEKVGLVLSGRFLNGTTFAGKDFVTIK